MARRWSRTTSAGKYAVEHSALIFETRAIGLLPLATGSWFGVWSPHDMTVVPRRNQVRLPSLFLLYPSNTAREVTEVVHRTRGSATRTCGRSPSPPAAQTKSQTEGAKRSDAATRRTTEDASAGNAISARLAVLQERIPCEAGVWKRTSRV